MDGPSAVPHPGSFCLQPSGTHKRGALGSIGEPEPALRVVGASLEAVPTLHS